MNATQSQPLGAPPLLLLPFVHNSIPAGFPSPAEDFAVKRVDLNDLLIMHPLATFLHRARGTSMIEAGIHDGDVLVVDRALRPEHGHIVIAQVENEFTVKYLYKRAGRIKLVPANSTYPEIVPKEGQTLEINGVVTGSITVFPPLSKKLS